MAVVIIVHRNYALKKAFIETFVCFKSQLDKQNLIDEMISSDKIEKKETINVFLKKNKTVHVFTFSFYYFV